VGGRWHDFGLPLPSFSRRVLSRKHCGPVWRQAQPTDTTGISGAIAVENYCVLHLYMHTSLAALCNEILCSKRLRGSPVAVNEPISDARGPSRHFPHFICLSGAARWPLCSPPACRQPRTWLSAGMGQAFFSLEPQSTRRHMKKRRRSLGRTLLHARALRDHGAPRRSPQKLRVVDRGHISNGYSTEPVCRKPEERPAALICAGAPQSESAQGLTRL
jgi:hypothetical protein